MAPARQFNLADRTEPLGVMPPTRLTIYDVMAVIACLGVVLAGRHNANIADLMLFVTYGLVPGLVTPLYLVGRSSRRIRGRALVDILMIGVPAGLIVYLLLLVKDAWLFDPARWAELVYLPAPPVTLAILVLVRFWPWWLQPADGGPRSVGSQPRDDCL